MDWIIKGRTAEGGCATRLFVLLGGDPRLQQRTHAASGHLKFATEHQIDGLGISDVFLLEDAARE